MMSDLPLVSIIIPYFNVELYIAKSAESLFKQTYENIEFIFVDDASPDRSRQNLEIVIDLFPQLRKKIRIMTHEVNKGLPAARNTGLALANGEYIYHCDSDDWIEANMIEEMVDAAIVNEADIVYSDFYLTFVKNERYLKQPSFSKSSNCIRSMLQGGMKYNVWNKLIKKSLYKENNIWFPSGRGMGEDMTIIKLFVYANRVVHLPKGYYHYVQTNTSAFTKTFSQKHLEDMLFNAKDILDFLSSMYSCGELNQDFNYFKLNLKLPFLISLDSEMYNLWRVWFPEANKYIDTNPSFSFRIKLLQHAALKELDWVVRMYNFLIVKLVYGIIYK